MTRRVLLAEPDSKFRTIASVALGSLDYEIEVATSARAAERLLAEAPFDALILAHPLPDAPGLEWLTNLRTARTMSGGAHDLAVLISGPPDMATAAQAIRAGADEYLPRPVELRELLMVLERALENRRERQLVRRQHALQLESLPQPVSEAASPMRRVMEQLERVAAARDTTVLLLGESGTGKDLLARLLHHKTPSRSGGPFLTLNCACMPASILEAELFGRSQGDFSEATADKPSLMELADGGTLFLDEVGELPLPLQAKLLRVVETGTYRSSGDGRERKADVRFVAATIRDLPTLVSVGAFRMDLFYRLDVFHLRLPALRERQGDVLLLAHGFLKEFAAKLKRPAQGFTPEAEAALLAYDFPGNVRELRNAIERAVILEAGHHVGLTSLQLGRPGAAPSSGPLERRSDRPPTLAELERDYLYRLLEYASGDRTLVAQLMGVPYPTVQRKIADYGLDISQWKLH